MKYIILFTSREGAPDAVGPFDSEEEATEHLEDNITLEAGWDAEVIQLENPNAEV